MIKINNLPRAYIPFSNLSLCTNKVIGKSIIVAVDEVPPLLIGKGHKILIWLQALSELKSGKFDLIIDESISRNKNITIIEDTVDKSTDAPAAPLKIYAGSNLILNVAATDDNSASIEYIDLRPLGIKIFGDDKGLNVGTTHYKDYIFQTSARVLFTISISRSDNASADSTQKSG